jgi:hypothetical protein
VTALRTQNGPLVIRKGMAELDSFLVNPKNIQQILSSPTRLSVRYLLVDPNDTCNVHCLYCPNKRSNGRIELDDFNAPLAQAARSNPVDLRRIRPKLPI